jgi:hypothetical protein
LPIDNSRDEGRQRFPGLGVDDLEKNFSTHYFNGVAANTNVNYTVIVWNVLLVIAV